MCHLLKHRLQMQGHGSAGPDAHARGAGIQPGRRSAETPLLLGRFPRANFVLYRTAPLIAQIDPMLLEFSLYPPPLHELLRAPLHTSAESKQRGEQATAVRSRCLTWLPADFYLFASLNIEGGSSFRLVDFFTTRNQLGGGTKPVIQYRIRYASCVCNTFETDQ